PPPRLRLPPVLTAPAAPCFCPLSLHDALPIFLGCVAGAVSHRCAGPFFTRGRLVGSWLRWGVRRRRAIACSPRRSGRPTRRAPGDRKSTRLNSSHVKISYAVFCLKKKKPTQSLMDYRSLSRSRYHTAHILGLRHTSVSSISTPPLPSFRWLHTAVWTGLSRGKPNH